MKPFISQMVHYIDTDNDHCAAMIVALDEHETYNADTKHSDFVTQANLVVWNSYGAHMPKEGVTYDATAKKPGTWHFVEETLPQAIPDASGGPSSAGDSLPKSDKAA